MLLKKEQVLNSILTLPDEFSLDDVVEKLLLIDRINKGLEEVELGNIIPHDIVKEKYKKWLK